MKYAKFDIEFAFVVTREQKKVPLVVPALDEEDARLPIGPMRTEVPERNSKAPALPGEKNHAYRDKPITGES